MLFRHVASLHIRLRSVTLPGSWLQTRTNRLLCLSGQPMILHPSSEKELLISVSDPGWVTDRSRKSSGARYRAHHRATPSSILPVRAKLEERRPRGIAQKRVLFNNAYKREFISDNQQKIPTKNPVDPVFLPERGYRGGVLFVPFCGKMNSLWLRMESALGYEESLVRNFGL